MLKTLLEFNLLVLSGLLPLLGLVVEELGKFNDPLVLNKDLLNFLAKYVQVLGQVCQGRRPKAEDRLGQRQLLCEVGLRLGDYLLDEREVVVGGNDVQVRLVSRVCE